MSNTSDSTKSTKPADHEWVVAAELPVPADVARYADFRGSFLSRAQQRVTALEVYCKGCRRPYEDVADEKCSALLDNRHLIGGDQSRRAKRLPTPQAPAGARMVPGHTYSRRGVEAYVHRLV
ncbi:hypothetical protein [Streptomyces sp. MJM8645]|uniref:hypothetical protein n=1 Tax=Streptomycetaceae TaxID=2062 RepID=UPI0007AF88CB|nr:hypothetical protein [Streptomyces sp. MJM8645]